MAAPKYTIDASLAGFNVSKAAFLAANPRIARLMAAAVVVRPNQSSPCQPQALLVCRAATDSYPLTWEVPGGSVDAADATVLDGLARELREESGLVAAHMAAPVLLSPEGTLAEAARAGLGIQPADEVLSLGDDGLTVTFVETGNTWAKLTALVTVRSTDEVVLRPEEHGEAAWVTEEDVLRGELPGGQGRKIRFLSDGVRRTILDGFRVYAQSVAN